MNLVIAFVLGAVFAQFGLHPAIDWLKAKLGWK
jgi:hypothetical protein